MVVNMKRSVLIFMLMFVVLIVGVGVGYYLNGYTQPYKTPVDTNSEEFFQVSSSTEQGRDSVSAELQRSRETAITRTVRRVSSAVVGISVVEIVEYHDPFFRFFEDDPFFRQFFGRQFSYQQPVKGLGSGFIISPDGYIVTNDHVAGNAKEITVTLTNGEKYSAKIVGHDVVSDIALLKIDGKNLPYLQLGNSDDVVIGEWVIAFGNPFGMFEINEKPYVTVGVVSALHMNLQSDDPRRSYRNMIGTDAAINSGNSGGPLVNSLGEVIGVNTIIYTPNQGNIGLGFAIPINRVKSVISQLRKHGKIERASQTGIALQKVDARIAKYFGLPKPMGVIVTDVARNSPAERAGLKVDDVIIEANGERIDSEQDINGIVNELNPGDVLRLKIFRDGRYQTITLKLDSAK